MYLGIDIGGTKCAVSAAEVCGDKIEIRHKVKFETAGTPQEMIERFCEEIDRMSLPCIDAIGISCGGPLDVGNGVILSPPNLPGWDNVPICSILEQRFGVPVFLQNDADACALAEWKFGAAKGMDNIVFLTFGTGLGAGLILNGRLYSGADGCAGEIGHVRLCETGPVGFGKAGSAEGFCSGGGIAQIGATIARERLQMGQSCSFCPTCGDMDRITAKLIAEKANEGFEDAKSVYRVSAENLGRILALLTDLLNPQMIVIGSVYARCEHLLCEEALRVMRAESLRVNGERCRVMPAALGDAIGDVAALSVAYYGLQNGEDV